MNIFKFLEADKLNNNEVEEMIVSEINEIDQIVQDSKDRVLRAIDVETLSKKKDASFDLRLACLNVLEDLKSKDRIVSYDSALVLRTESVDKKKPRYDLEYIMAFRIKDGTVHKYVYCDNVLERTEK
ncbi:MAG: hypothetical protein NT162_03650 [Candidatus Woesebacteria bacterium]|nr:hypothetical protein [Candidatus Woesebacteria bacterium]